MQISQYIEIVEIEFDKLAEVIAGIEMDFEEKEIITPERREKIALQLERVSAICAISSMTSDNISKAGAESYEYDLSHVNKFMSELLEKLFELTKDSLHLPYFVEIINRVNMAFDDFCKGFYEERPY